MDGHIGQACEHDIILAKHVILWMDGWMDGHIGQACYIILPMNTHYIGQACDIILDGWMDGWAYWPSMLYYIAHEYDIILAKHVILYWMDGWAYWPSMLYCP